MKKDKCLDPCIIQAFIDGELSHDQSENAVGHIALCDSCATLLAETEEESAFVFLALSEELNVLVPTERLRTKVFGSINEAKEKSTWWGKVTASIGFAEGFNFRSPSLVAFASVVLFVSAVAVGVNFYEPKPNDGDVTVSIDSVTAGDDIGNVLSGSPAVKDQTPDFPVDRPSAPVGQPERKVNDTRGFRVMNASGTNKSVKRNRIKPRKIIRKTIDAKVETAVNRTPPPSPNLTGEDSYLQTIATLNRTVDDNKDMTLRPTERIAFERDMAVVNDAIKKMKREVRKNPKNRAAREVLRASYKNKIDLLNSVAERTELMASIQ